MRRTARFVQLRRKGDDGKLHGDSLTAFTAPVAKVFTNIALRPHRCDGYARERTFLLTKSRNPRGTEESKLAAPTALIERNPPRVPLVDRATPIKDSMWLERKP